MIERTTVESRAYPGNTGHGTEMLPGWEAKSSQNKKLEHESR